MPPCLLVASVAVTIELRPCAILCEHATHHIWVTGSGKIITVILCPDRRYFRIPKIGKILNRRLRLFALGKEEPVPPSFDEAPARQVRSLADRNAFHSDETRNTVGEFHR